MPPRPERPLLFLDYDGTLAPIVNDPAEAYPHPDIPDLLTELFGEMPVFVVTGRHLNDLERLLNRPLPAIGLHGTQTGTIGGGINHSLPEGAAQALEDMRQRVPAVDGVHVEPKGHAFAVHYRNAPDQEAARLALEEWARETPAGLEAIWGKKVVELRPQGTSKGVAVRRVADEHPDRVPVYLGDDVTDEDAFRELPPPAVTIKVGDGETAARHRLASVDEVVRYLRGYLDED